MNEQVHEDALLNIQIASDLHLEFPTVAEQMPSIPVKSKVLALLGDIGIPRLTHPSLSMTYEQFLYKQGEVFDLVLVVAGNHEYYGSEVYTTKQLISSMCQNAPRSNIVFLDRTTHVYHIPGVSGDEHPRVVKFVGCTLWTNVPPSEQSLIQDAMNDYRKIEVQQQQQLETNERRKLTVRDTVKWHQEEVEFLKSEINKSMNNPNETVCILTHHSPLIEGTVLPDETFIGCAMASDLRGLMKPWVTFWGFGHTHRNVSSRHVVDTPYNSKTRVVSNQLGYLKNKEDTIVKYDADLVFGIPERPAQSTGGGDLSEWITPKPSESNDRSYDCVIG